MNFAVLLVFPVLVAKLTFALLAIQSLGIPLQRRPGDSFHRRPDGDEHGYDAEPRKDRRGAMFGGCYSAIVATEYQSARSTSAQPH
jgi:hypothetical protein